MMLKSRLDHHVYFPFYALQVRCKQIILDGFLLHVQISGFFCYTLYESDMKEIKKAIEYLVTSINQTKSDENQTNQTNQTVSAAVRCI